VGFLLLMQKVFNALSGISFILVLAIGAGGFITYKWATSPKTHEQIKEQVVEGVKDSLKVPSMTGVASAVGGGSTKLPF